MSASRRQFLKTAAASSFLLGVPALSAQMGTKPTKAKASNRGAARNVILLVSDGMSIGALAMAEQFRQRRDGRGTAWMSLYGRPDIRRALMDTESASSIVTDSAAAGSAWGGGMRVANGALNIGTNGERPEPIMSLARGLGKATGLVSTASITHATPASFAVNTPSRNAEAAIADLYLETGIDLFLGGGSNFFDPTVREDGVDAFAAFARKGYAVVRDKTALAKAPRGKRLLGIFVGGQMPYALDHEHDSDLRATVPTLPEMTRLALDHLAAAGGDKGFVLQVEGARIDHAAHINDFGGLVHDQLAFDDAVAETLRWVEGRDDTLVIVTTDHGNSNPGLNGTGARYDGSLACFEHSFTFKHTNDWVVRGLTADSPGEAMRERVYAATGLGLEPNEVKILQASFRGEYRDAYRVHHAPTVILGQLLANHISVGWNGVTHTSDWVELLAFGPGSEAVNGLVLNTEVNTMMRRAMGLA